MQQSLPPSGELKGALRYDPLVGRFLSADNVIQDPTSTQNYNRYSYCLNNPLKYVDPSGYRMAAADQYRDLGADHFEMRIGNRDSSGNHIFGQSADNGGADGGYSDYWTSLLSNMQNYPDGETNISISTQNNNGTMSFSYYTESRQLDNSVDPGAPGAGTMLGGVSLIRTKHVFTINAQGGGGGNGYSDALYLANTLNSLYDENATRNLRALERDAAGWMRRVPSSINKAMDANKFTKVITKSVGKKLFGVGLVFSFVDMYQDPSASNVGWNVADGLVGWAAFVPGLQIPALIYFSARISYDIYDAYNKP